MTQGPVPPIPLVLMEEHHESFYVWNYALQKGWMPRRPHTLLHVDSHADMWLPKLRHSLDLLKDLTDLARFVYGELDIGSFIWPAVYMGMFDRVLWLKDHHRMSAGGWRTMTVGRKNCASTEFVLAFPDQTMSCTLGDKKTTSYAPITPGECIKTDQPIILDIDLDYFCCNDYPDLPVREIEVTHDTFLDFSTNPYHFLRLSPGDKISAAMRKEKYYLIYNDYHSVPTDAQQCRREVSERIDRFICCLRKNTVEPTLILICRSFFSGYTPGEFVKELQNAVVNELSRLYRIEQYSMEDILPDTILHEYARGWKSAEEKTQPTLGISGLELCSALGPR